MTKDTIIIGAGLTGLTTAFYAKGAARTFWSLTVSPLQAVRCVPIL